MERWGALSVKDHIDVRALAGDVLLYDRLVVPTPPDWDVARWEQEGWDPEGLKQRLKKLEGLVYRANWGVKEQEGWANEFAELVSDAKQFGMEPSEEAAMLLTKFRLAQDERVKKGDGIIPEVVAAFRSEKKLLEAIRPELTAVIPPQPAPTGLFSTSGRQSMPAEMRIDVIVGTRIVVPNYDNEDDALSAAIDIAKDRTYRERRQTAHAWQRLKVDEWQKRETITEEEMQAAGRELDDLIERYNQLAKKAARKRRTETAILVATLGAGAVALGAGFAPWLFASAAAGGLAGSQLVQVGAFGASGLLQCIKHSISRSEPDAAARVPLVGAMFHQLENRSRWQQRHPNRFPFLML